MARIYVFLKHSCEIQQYVLNCHILPCSLEIYIIGLKKSGINFLSLKNLRSLLIFCIFQCILLMFHFCVGFTKYVLIHGQNNK